MTELEVLAQGTGAPARQARRTLKRRAAAAKRGGGFADFAPLEQALDDFASRISPNERAVLARSIATELRDANAKRMRANTQPDGAPMIPRKQRAPGKDRTKRIRDEVTGRKRQRRGGKMFLRATAPRYLRKESSQGEAAVGFVGAMARIMEVHQYGLSDHVTRDPNSPTAVYPARVVLGFTDEDRSRILDQVAAQLG